MKESEMLSLQNKIWKAAVEKAKKKKCKKCGRDKGLRVVPLYEHTPFLPSKMALFCPRCYTSEMLIWEKGGRVEKFCKAVQAELDSQGIIST